MKNQPSIDGNKRAGFMAACTFPAANGEQLMAPEKEAGVRTPALAASEIAAAEYAAWLALLMQPRE